MPHQDQGRSVGAPAVRTALDWLATSGMFDGLSFRRECRWKPERLVQATLLWAWSEETSLVDRFFAAQQVIAPSGDEQRESVSYQAFVKLLRRHTARLLGMLIVALQGQMEQKFSASGREASLARRPCPPAESCIDLLFDAGDGGFDDCGDLGFQNLRIGDRETATAVAEHRVLLVKLSDAVLHERRRNVQLLGEFALGLGVVRKEFVQRRIQQADRDW